MNGLSVYSGSSDASLRSRFTQICARLGADVVRYSFIVVDLHHLLLASLPAHLCKNAAAPKRSRITFGQITVKDAKILKLVRFCLAREISFSRPSKFLRFHTWGNSVRMSAKRRQGNVQANH